MRFLARLSFVERFIIALTAWTGFIYALLFVLRFSTGMVPHEILARIVFGPAVLILVSLAAYELHLYRHHGEHRGR